LARSDKNKILVLSRSNETLNTVQQALRKAGGVKPGEVRFETFHRAKGLQGEVAILCENCVYEESHPLRNAIYAASGLFRQSYDEAARDEALRLAYVAVTRGIRRVLWFVDQPKGASALLPSRP
jgi:ATP-dependent exoDNAse (exonuclease V) beta subunit